MKKDQGIRTARSYFSYKVVFFFPVKKDQRIRTVRSYFLYKVVKGDQNMKKESEVKIF